MSPFSAPHPQHDRHAHLLTVLPIRRASESDCVPIHWSNSSEHDQLLCHILLNVKDVPLFSGPSSSSLKGWMLKCRPVGDVRAGLALGQKVTITLQPELRIANLYPQSIV